MMRILRYLYGGYFFFCSVVCLIPALKTILDKLSGNPPDIRGPRDAVGITVMYLFIIPGIVFGKASIIAVHENKSQVVRGRVWPMLASLMSLCAGLVSLWAFVASGQIFMHEKYPWVLLISLFIPLGAGAAGLLVFPKRRNQSSS